ncbi:hybrid sensor histidine kinase/response regulator transcription factor [Leeuwenhoekiella blandensis]|uniref:histidine kinase n=1 Tax=Leeuwenhoekiella blandensis (strain CECT 7118 / CCUG 51940 / KCTC 22103 / MED217) TaxID=398720 RepID=A3XMF2_LEEBM|nr:two-component regulator propeller domain-containing protein [Leeuwenhoekiella blandensis]EAQ49275.1 two-component system sensor histidine kinase/response regulator,hybrid ('one-component system') [Leeuwenhoekiella blandensis MED217]
MKLRHLFLLIVISFPLSFFAQTTREEATIPLTQKLTFYNIDTHQGLSNNIVKTIEQDSLGFIWIGTADGLNRYDGDEFKVFRRESSMLSNNYIQDISFNQQGEVVLATDGGLNIYNQKQEQFDLLNNYNSYLTLSTNSYQNLQDGTYAIGAYNQGVLIFKDKEQKFYFGQGDQNTNGLSSVKISCLIKQDNKLWVGSFDGGLDKIDLKSHKITHLPLTINKKEIKRINTLFVDSHKSLWVGTDSGLIGISKSGEQITLSEGQANNELSGDNIIAIEEDDLGQLWVGTHKSGLNIFKIPSFTQSSKNLDIIKFSPKDNGTSIYNASINDLKKDKNGYMWIGTDSGINFVDPKEEPIKSLKNDLIGEKKLVHNRITSIYEADLDKIYLGTDGGGVDSYNPETGHFSHGVFNEKNGLTSNHLNVIKGDSQNNLWIGTYKGGLNRYNFTSKQWQYYLQGSIENGYDVRCIFEDPYGTLWVGTNRGGLFKFDPEKNKFNYVDALDKISARMDIRAIDIDSKQTLWIATYGNGIISYNLKDQSVYSYHNGNLQDLTTNVIFCIKVLKDDSIVAGLKYGGLVHFKEGDDKATNYTEYEGLSNNTVNSIISHNDSTLFLGTYKGISKLNLKSKKIESLNSFNNIQISEYNVGAVIKSWNNQIFFGGNKGLTVFKPEELNIKQELRSIVIKDFKLADDNLVIDSKDANSVLEQSIAYKDKINLDHNQTNFSLEFTSFNFPFANNTNYAYILEGFNDHWIDLKNANRINLSNIPPGDYNLKIKAESLASNSFYKDLQIHITPPIWKTIPAYIFYILCIIFLIWAGLRYYTERLKLTNSLILEKNQRKLEQELNEERIRFYTGFSHELKTPLTLILAPLETLLLEIEQKQHLKSLKLIKRNADSLLQFINKLLEFRKSEEGLSELKINQFNISKHISAWLNSYDPLLKRRAIELVITMPQNPIFLYCDIDKIQIIVNNLLSNAIKYSTSQSKIQIELSQDEYNAYFKVQDFGPGIKPNDLDHIFEWYYQSKSSLKKDGSGIGLALSKRFAKLHNGSLEVKSKINKGSTFILTLPKDDSLLNKCLDNDSNAQSNTKFIENQIKSTTDQSKKQTDINPLLVKPEDQRKLILLIDDNPDILEFLDSALAQDYDLIHAEDGEAGIAQACKYVPDLIISDVMMPFKNGIELCQFIKSKKETSHIPIILLSAKSNFNFIETGYNKGADDYMLKPFNVKVLRARIKNLIESRSFLLQTYTPKDNTVSSKAMEQKKLIDVEKEFLAEFHEIVYKNMQQGIKTVSVVAEEIGMSRSSLYRKIKAVTGKNINEYIRNIKIEHAAYLIEKEKFTISQAAYEVGFGDAKYFRKIFKERFGKTPSAFKPN